MWRESFIITRRSAFISSQERLGFQQPHSAPYLTRGSPLPTQARSRWARSSRRFSQRQNPAQSASLPPIQSSHTHGPTGRPICCTRSTSLTSGSIKGGRSSPAAGPTDREQGKAHRPRSGLRIHLFPLLPDRHAWGWGACQLGRVERRRALLLGRAAPAGGSGHWQASVAATGSSKGGAGGAGGRQAAGGRAAGRQRAGSVVRGTRGASATSARGTWSTARQAGCLTCAQPSGRTPSRTFPRRSASGAARPARESEADADGMGVGRDGQRSDARSAAAPQRACGAGAGSGLQCAPVFIPRK